MHSRPDDTIDRNKDTFFVSIPLQIKEARIKWNSEEEALKTREKFYYCCYYILFFILFLYLNLSTHCEVDKILLITFHLRQMCFVYYYLNFLYRCLLKNNLYTIKDYYNADIYFDGSKGKKYSTRKSKYSF